MKTIIITGASKGIGFELVKIALNNKANVIAISRNITPLNVFIKNKKFKAFSIDITNGQELKQKLISYIQEQKIKVDILINNAGQLINNKFIDFERESAVKIFDTNFFAPAFLIQNLLQFFENPAHIVNISSMGGFQGAPKFPGLSFYSASKSALATLTECLAEELKDNNIYLNTLSLGAVNTQMLQEAFPGYKAQIQPETMAEFIYMFANQAFKLVNGKNFPLSITTP